MPRCPIGYTLSHPAQASNASRFLFKPLRLDSLTTGETEMTTIANASASSKAVFGFQVPVRETAIISRVIFDIVDSMVEPGDFGGINNGLANGLKIMCVDGSDNTIIDFLDGMTIKRNHQFSWLAGNDVAHVESTKDDHLPVRWTLEKAGTTMRLKENEKFIIEVRDNLSAITSMQVLSMDL